VPPTSKLRLLVVPGSMQQPSSMQQNSTNPIYLHAHGRKIRGRRASNCPYSRRAFRELAAKFKRPGSEVRRAYTSSAATRCWLLNEPQMRLQSRNKALLPDFLTIDF
jgi:hypothetical protein